MGALQSRDRLKQRFDPFVRGVGFALHVELDQLRMPIPGDLAYRACAQVRHLRHRAELRHHFADSGAEGRGADVEFL
jgi:hypothetical protein